MMHTITLHCDDAAYAAIVEEVRFRLGDDAVPESGLRSLSGSVIADIIRHTYQIGGYITTRPLPKGGAA